MDPLERARFLFERSLRFSELARTYAQMAELYLSSCTPTPETAELSADIQAVAPHLVGRFSNAEAP